jgi:hypothetical protein
MAREPSVLHIDKQPGTDVITTIDDASLKTLATDIGKSIELFAISVIIDGPVRLPGREVSIRAQRVECRNGAMIDVSGPDGTSAAQSAKDPEGKNGANGSQGGGGGVGGKVSIHTEHLVGDLVISVRGGTGGAGQPGGNGLMGDPGANGRRGRDTIPERDHRRLGSRDVPGEPGGPGGQGGSAGRGGAGGAGGAAGSADIRVRDLSQGSIRFDAFNGGRGSPGANGESGPGGPGGVGGRNDRHHSGQGGREPDPPYWESRSSLAPSGPVGPTGLKAEAPPAATPPSAVATDSFVRLPIDFRFADSTSTAHCRMVLRKTEIEYLNGQYDSVSERLRWLEELTSGSGQVPAYPSSVPSLASPEAERAGLHARVVALQAQLQAGLDVYGYPRNYVSLLDRAIYRDTFLALQPLVQRIEETRERYLSAESGDTERLAATEDGFNQALATVQGLSSEIAAVDRGIQDALQEFALLDGALKLQQNALLSCGEHLDHAVQAAVSCDVLGTIQFVASVVSVAYGSYGQIAGIVEGAKGSVPVQTKLQGGINIVKVLRGGIEEASKAYGQFRPQLEADGSVKFAMEDADLDAHLKAVEAQLDALSEAVAQERERYRQLCRLFVKTARARSQRQLDVAALTARRQGLAGEQSSMTAEVARLRSLRADVRRDRSLQSDLVVFFDDLLQRSTAALFRMLYQYKKAVEYWSLTPFEIRFESHDVSAVGASFIDIVTRETSELERRDDLQRFPGPVSVVVASRSDPGEPSVIVLPDAFEQFRSARASDGAFVLTFAIPFDHAAFRRGWKGIVIDSIALKVEGLSTADGEVAVKLVHSGDASFVRERRADRSLDVIRFSHAPRSRLFNFKVGASTPATIVSETFGTARTYAYLSPFTIWHLIVSPLDNDRPSAENVERVTLAFNGYFAPL